MFLKLHYNTVLFAQAPFQIVDSMPPPVNALKKKFEMEMCHFIHVGDFPSVNNSSTIPVESSTSCASRVLTKVVRAPDINGG